jgi:small subunit ribosomal protein S16
MPVVLRLMRAGAKKRPFYRIVAADSRRQRDGRFLEIVGHYDPMRSPAELVLEKDRIQEWLSNGAAPSTQVASLLRQAGMAMIKASTTNKKPAAAAKGTKKRAVKRKVSERKVRAKAARKAGKKKPAVKKPKKK